MKQLEWLVEGGLAWIPNWLVYLVVILGAVYAYGTWDFNIFKDVVGCTGPKPVPFLGTLPLYFRDGLQVDLKLKKLYGRSYGVFDGLNPSFVTSDLDLIKQIAIKDFDCFLNHRRVCITEPITKGLGAIKGDEWKQQRASAQGTITAAKLRKMSFLLEESADELIDVLNKHANGQGGEMIEMYNYIGKFTMDVIAKTQFGVHVHAHSDPNHPFIVHAKNIFSGWRVFQPAMFVYMFLPKLLPFIEKLNISYFKIYPIESIKFFSDIIMGIINNRVDSKQKHTDFLQMLLDTRNLSPKPKTDEIEFEETNQLANQSDKASAHHWRGAIARPLTDMEICGSSITFLLAGYETTAMTLGWVCYALSLHPEVQQKLYEEIRNGTAAGKKINYDMVMGIQYLDQVVNETLRRYSVTMRTDRICNRTCQIGPYTIPEGMAVQISTLGVHMDEEYYPDPTKYDPDRFAPENRHALPQNGLLTFGIGPRICIGLRFAMFEIKMLAAYLVNSFQIRRCEKTEDPVTCKKHAFNVPENGFWITLSRRAALNVKAD